MTEEAYNEHIGRIKRDAMKDGFTEEELSTKYLDGFSKWTKSLRIMRLVRLAYWRGMMRGVNWVKQAETPIVLK